MTISVFDLFSIGIGPSSSHTVGPMRAARAFLLALGDRLSKVKTVTVCLHGSLAFTGDGHGTDKAILLGLLGEAPETVDPETITKKIQTIRREHKICLLQKHTIEFNATLQLRYDFEKLFTEHSNAMVLTAEFSDGSKPEATTYFSIGGGFIVTQADFANTKHNNNEASVPFPFNSAAQLLTHCQNQQNSIAEIMFANECTWRSPTDIRDRLLSIANVMENCVQRGCELEGILEGGLNVQRRAASLHRKLSTLGKPGPEHPHPMMWLNVYAMAVNEENAAGGRVVTAPTNGAAGIIPAVLQYYKTGYADASEQDTIDFLLTAGAIGQLYKENASISGAEAGCQGEVGVAASMAAAAFTAVRGGTPQQVENAAEIAMEHSLGLTCDPVGGLVQIPCIERNAMGAVKAVNAAQLAIVENRDHKVSLDMVIRTMHEVGRNMNSIYKETSKGGLAVNVVEC